MASLLRPALYLAAISSAAAWSAGPSSSRRGFLKDAEQAVAIAGAASVVGGGAANAGAAEQGSIYRPPPNSLAGQVHVVTGASSGLGLESAKRLAAAGATVVLTTRTADKGDAAQRQVLEYLEERSASHRDVHALTLNTDSLADVRSFPDRYGKALGPRKIDVLMNNIGTISRNREVTNDGLEKTFQTNHLGPFLLTAGLFPQMNREGSRIVNVASRAHNFAKIVKTGEQGLDLDNLDGRSSYGLDGWEAYGNTKLENILFSQELQRRADAAGLAWLTSAALHPGVVGTELWRNTAVGTPNEDAPSSLRSLASGLFYKNVWTNERGANTQVMLASADGIEKGRYYDEFGRATDLAPFARDPIKARELWEVSEKLSSCKFAVV